MDIHKREDYDIEFIQSLIDNGIEESINIDFKASGALSKDEMKKKEISKDVSAFANSNGGIIVYGLTEKNHKADSFSFIDGDIYSKEWLEQVISTTIQRNIEGLKIFPIRNNENIKESMYVVQIPESLNAPHINKDKKFYRRYDFQSVVMEEYEIRNLYGRKSKAKLVIGSYSISKLESNDDNLIKFRVRVDLINQGDIEESNYKLNSYFENFIPRKFNFSWEQSESHKKYGVSVFNENRVKLYNSGSTTIFPDETINVSDYYFHFAKDDVQEAFEKMEISFKVFFSGGDDTIKVDFKSLLAKYNETYTVKEY